MRGTSITKCDDDDVRSFFHRFVEETSIIQYDDDDDDDRSLFHRSVKGTTIDMMMMMMIEVSFTPV